MNTSGRDWAAGIQAARRRRHAESLAEALRYLWSLLREAGLSAEVVLSCIVPRSEPEEKFRQIMALAEGADADSVEGLIGAWHADDFAAVGAVCKDFAYGFMDAVAPPKGDVEI